MSIDFLACDFREDGTAVLKARLEAEDGSGDVQDSGMALLERADIASSGLTIKVFDESDSDTVTYTATLVTNSVLFDSLSTAWDVDTLGWNLKIVLPTTAFPTGGHVYRFELRVQTTGGTVAWLVGGGTAKAVKTS